MKRGNRGDRVNRVSRFPLIPRFPLTPLVPLFPLFPLFTLFTLFSLIPPVFAGSLLVDDFEEGTRNKLGGNSNVYVQEPSRILALRVKEKDLAHSGAGVLMLKFYKKAKGGPSDSGGWCGYYTLLGPGKRFLDAAGYQQLTFWVKGTTGEENFVVGIADEHWNEVGDSVKSEPIGQYLPSGKLTTEWQKAEVPLDAFLVDLQKLASLALCFEGSVLPGGEGKGTIYVDDLMLE